MAVRVTVVGQYDGRSLAAAQRDLDRLKRAQMANAGPMGKMAAGLKSQLTPNFMAMGAAVAAAGAALAAFAVELGVKGVMAAAEEEQAVNRLTQALDNVGQGFRIREVNAFVDSLQRSSGVADDVLRPALQTLVTATGDVTQAQHLLTLALDISAATGKDLSAVSVGLAKAANGQFTALKKLAPGLSASAIATGDLSVVTAELSRLYGGQAAANADSFLGSIARLKIAADELLESFGHGFLEAFDNSSQTMGDLSQKIKEAEPAIKNLGATFGGFFKLIVENGPAISGLIDAFTAATKAAMIMNGVPVYNWLMGIMKGGDDAAGAIDGTASASAGLADVFHGPVSSSTQVVAYGIDGVTESADQAEEAFQDLNDQMKTFFGFMDERDAVRSYQSAIDDLRASLKENGKTFDVNSEAGRNNQAALDDVYDSALKVAEGQATAAEKIDTMRQASVDAQRILDKTGLSEDAKNRLLEPFDNAIIKLSTATTYAGNLKQALYDIPDEIATQIRVDVTVNGKYYDPYGAYDPGSTNGSAYGGFVGGHGGSRADSIPAMLSSGEFVIQAPVVSRFGRGFFESLNNGVNPLAGLGVATAGGASAGMSIGSITVTSAPGERAEESLPRALRRMAFLAGA